MTTGDLAQRHAVVFDCNVYLDVARLTGPPFTQTKFAKLAATAWKETVPHPQDRAFDSLRAIAMSESGRFAGEETLEVWTNAHIDSIVRSKAAQSTQPDPVTGYAGLGWSASDAGALVSDLIGDLTASSNGGTLGATVPDSNPPLDHEDGMVFGACRAISSADLLCQVYCVTRDGGFIRAFREGRLSNCARVMSPTTYVNLLRSARVSISMRRMNGSGA